MNSLTFPNRFMFMGFPFSHKNPHQPSNLNMKKKKVYNRIQEVNFNLDTQNYLIIKKLSKRILFKLHIVYNKKILNRFMVASITFKYQINHLTSLRSCTDHCSMNASSPIKNPI